MSAFAGARPGHGGIRPSSSCTEGQESSASCLSRDATDPSGFLSPTTNYDVECVGTYTDRFGLRPLRRTPARERSRTISKDLPSPLTATGLLSLGLLLPLGAGTAPARVAHTVAAFVEQIPAKHVTFVRDGTTEAIETHAATAGELLAERGVNPAPDDVVSVPLDSALVDGETVVFRTAVPVSLNIDGSVQNLHSAAATVGDLLLKVKVPYDRHDDVSPPAGTALANDLTIVVRHVDHWTEIVQRPLPATVVKRFALDLPTGKSRVVDPGAPGRVEVTYRVVRTADRRGVRRTQLATRVLRPAHDRIVAEGIAEYTVLSELARRELVGTLKLANSALRMIATAYTAHCGGGCSGTTAAGFAAGHGIVAVDPAVIPLGTRLFIPGYGKAIAGDTGGAIRGNRIDLGFNSRSQANEFGRRPVVVYVYK